MSAGVEVQEWRRLAWAMGADDLAMDEPTDEADSETRHWRAWAERTHGARARDFIASFDALAAIRGTSVSAVLTVEQGPEAEPSPDPDLCPNCGEPYDRHSSMSRGPGYWACYYDGAHPSDEDLARVYDDEDGLL